MKRWQLVASLVAFLPAMTLAALVWQIASALASPELDAFLFPRVNPSTVAFRLTASLVPLAIAAALPIWVLLRSSWFGTGRRLLGASMASVVLVSVGAIALAGDAVVLAGSAFGVMTAASCFVTGQLSHGSQ